MGHRLSLYSNIGDTVYSMSFPRERTTKYCLCVKRIRCSSFLFRLVYEKVRVMMGLRVPILANCMKSCNLVHDIICTVRTSLLVQKSMGIHNRMPHRKQLLTSSAI